MHGAEEKKATKRYDLQHVSNNDLYKRLMATRDEDARP